MAGYRGRIDSRSAWRAASASAVGAVVLLALIITVGLTLRGSSPGAGSGSQAPGSSTASRIAAASPIAKAQALAAAEEFIGRPLVSPTVDDPTDWFGGRCYEIRESGGASFSVDVSTGRVISLMALPFPETTAVNFTPRQAQAAAAAFLTAHGIPFDGLTATVELRDHGCCKEYEVTWQRYVNGASVPDTRRVGVDPATGNVFSFGDYRVSYAPVPTPAITREDAIARAIKKSGLSSPKIEAVSLTINESPILPAWKGRLVWSVQLSQDVPINPGSSVSYSSAYWISVDAITGEAVITGQG